MSMRISASLFLLCFSLLFGMTIMAEQNAIPAKKLQTYADCLSDYHAKNKITTGKAFEDSLLSCKTLRDELVQSAATKVYVQHLEKRAREILRI